MTLVFHSRDQRVPATRSSEGTFRVFVTYSHLTVEGPLARYEIKLTSIEKVHFAMPDDGGFLHDSALCYSRPGTLPADWEDIFPTTPLGFGLLLDRDHDLFHWDRAHRAFAARLNELIEDARCSEGRGYRG